MKKTAALPWMEKKMTPEEIEEFRLKVVEAIGGARVHAFCFEDNEEDGQVIGFLRQPGLEVKSRSLDNMGSDKVLATGSSLLESLLIREFSDPRISDGNPDHDQYQLGARAEAVSLIKVSRNTLKKK